MRTPSGGAAIRPARAEDLLTLRRVWETADGLTPGPAEVLPLHRHLLATGTVLVADDDGRVVGFGAVIERGDVVLLSDLFVVEPGRGIGRRILTQLRQRHPSPQWCTLASAHPAAVPLYQSIGLAPVASVSYLEGVVEPGHVVADRFEVEPIDERIRAWLDGAWDRPRSVDVAYWASLGAVAVTVGGREPCGVALVCPHTPWHPAGDSVRIGPVVSVDADAAAEVMTAAVAVAADLAGGARPVRALLPHAHPATRMLSAVGLVEVDRDVLMATARDLVDPVRHIGAADLW